MLPSRSLFQPHGCILLRDSCSGDFPGLIVTIAAPLSLARFFKSAALLGIGKFVSPGCPPNIVLKLDQRRGGANGTGEGTHSELDVGM